MTLFTMWTAWAVLPMLVTGVSEAPEVTKMADICYSQSVQRMFLELALDYVQGRSLTVLFDPCDGHMSRLLGSHGVMILDIPGHRGRPAEWLTSGGVLWLFQAEHTLRQTAESLDFLLTNNSQVVHSRYIVVVLTPGKSLRKDVFSILAKRNLTDVLLVTPSILDPDWLTAFNYESVSDTEELRVKTIDTWCGDEFFNRTDLFPDRFSSLNGMTWRAATFHYPPYNFKGYDNTGRVRYDGHSSRVLRVILESMNCSMVDVEPTDNGRWGRLLDNGSYDGLKGMLTRGEADVIVSYMWLNEVDTGAGDPTVYYDNDMIICAVPFPNARPPWAALVRPFPPEVWTVLLLSIGVVTLLLWFGSKSTIFLSPLRQCFVIIVAPLLERDVRKFPLSNSGRIFVSFWLLYAVVIITAYRSAMVSMLSTPRYLPPIDTMEELAHSSLILGGEADLRSLLQDFPEPHYIRIYNRFQDWSDINETLTRLILHRNVATFSDKTQLEYELLNRTPVGEMPVFHLTNERLMTVDIVMYVPFGFKYLPLLNEKIRWVVQAGLSGRLKDGVLENAGLNPARSRARPPKYPKPFTLKMVEGSFYLLIIGLTLSLILFACERVYYKMCHKHKCQFVP